MKTILCWADLARYGIAPDGWESCRLSFRFRVRLDLAGRRLIEDALGISTTSDCAVLSADVLRPLAICALLADGCTAVLEIGEFHFHGFEASEYAPHFTKNVPEGTSIRAYWTSPEHNGVLCHHSVR